MMIRYDGIPAPIEEEFGVSGFLPTDDGTLVAGEPHVASTWFAVNDHPLDKATYTFTIRVPHGLEAIANGELTDMQDVGDWTRWTWDVPEPMAPYLATATIGEFDVNSYEADGIKYWDAMDPDLFAVPAPRTGSRYALTGFAESLFQATDANDRRAIRRSDPLLLGRPRYGAELGLLLRGGPRRGNGRLDHPAGR